jgi:predicted nucleic acid-binding protein
MSRLAYADSSALVKLVVQEAESPAIYRWFIESERVVTSRVGVIETVRASSRYPFEEAHRAHLLDLLEVVELTPEIAGRAGDVQPALLRTLDAVHLATALAIGTDLDAFVTYDARLASAARTIGLPVIRPGGGSGPAAGGTAQAAAGSS